MPSPIATSNIVAQAFRFMELRPISSIADGSPQAQAAAEQYPDALNLCLEAYDWGFARRLVTLPPTETLPSGTGADPDLPGLFTLPADFLTLRHVYPEGLAFRIDQDVLRAAQVTALTIRYTARQSNEARMPPAFRTAVSCQLAVRLAPEWVQSRTKRETLAAELAEAMRAAIRAEHSSASHYRMDGRPEQADWAGQATL